MVPSTIPRGPFYHTTWSLLPPLCHFYHTTWSLLPHHMVPSTTPHGTLYHTTRYYLPHHMVPSTTHLAHSTLILYNTSRGTLPTWSFLPHHVYTVQPLYTLLLHVVLSSTPCDSYCTPHGHFYLTTDSLYQNCWFLLYSSMWPLLSHYSTSSSYHNGDDTKNLTRKIC